VGHDERFKLLLREFLREFFELFFPDLVGLLDFTAAVWLHQELITDPPEGEKRTIDLLVSIPLLQAKADELPQTVLIHIEVESDDTVQPFRRRMYEYYHHLTHILNLNVLPVAVYLRVGLNGRGRDLYQTEVLGRTPLHFEYDYVGLPALPGADYLAQSNLLGQALSALMNWPKRERARAAVEALERIVGSGEAPRRKMLLCDTVNAYAPLDDAQRVELTSLLREPTRKEVEMTVKTWFEEGVEKGVFTGQRRLLLAQLEARFGPLNETARQRLEAWPAEQLTDLGLAFVDAKSLAELGLED
jgi:hypothetical protein